MKGRRLFVLTLALGAVALLLSFFLSSQIQRELPQQKGTTIVEMTTRQWRFDVVKIEGEGRAFTKERGKAFADTLIEVPLGTQLILKIKNLDVPHGFALEEYGIVVLLPPGEVTTITLKALKKGEFTFFCNVFCGTGHPLHKGVLIVR